ncbi:MULTISPECIES: hypothetical protein [Spirosoma]|uniref:Uncharacterized protein n=1 Tax=Spirosoma liriopis TaxID=2937440 RepID=A0ABT0HEI8_9BACT|nr:MULTISPECIES: hypothetical protein [Spirosoma]MCK8490405.1 hypothetical protein [Spirosoma liriopis]UHG89776.1 hypothetical protein LQ777_16160 [Spirosoma oryzicola]
MRAQRPKKGSSINELTADQVLVRWITAVSILRTNYNQLTESVDKQVRLIKGVTTCVGQCPINQLTDLLAAMETELENLLLDVDQFDPLYASKKNIKKIVAHTLILEALNERAQTVLYLAAQPAS